MSEQIQRRMVRDSVKRMDRARGLHTTVMRFSSARTAETQIASIARLPTNTDQSEVSLQDGSYNLVYLSGYST
jgi:hypothetical protein